MIVIVFKSAYEYFAPRQADRVFTSSRHSGAGPEAEMPGHWCQCGEIRSSTKNSCPEATVGAL